MRLTGHESSSESEDSESALDEERDIKLQDRDDEAGSNEAYQAYLAYLKNTDGAGPSSGMNRHSGSPDRVRRNEVFSGSDTYGEITIEVTRQ